MILPKSRTRHVSPTVRDRTKHPKLVGADLYVARLAPPPSIPPKKAARDIHTSPPTARCPLVTLPAPAPTLTGSLHDELICREAPNTSESSGEGCGGVTRDFPTAGESRPCYRCISYMHSAGIKRVFWTNKDGTWTGAKVRDLVDVLERPSPGESNDEIGELEAGLSGVFVTKHEILMLRRLFAQNG